MTDFDRDADKPAEPAGQQAHLPLTLAYLLRAARRVQPPSGPGPARAPAAPNDADVILRALYEKMQSLSDAQGAMRAMINTAADPSKRDRIVRQRQAAIAEYQLCDARHTAINYGGPFRALPAGEEGRLVVAIQSVAERLADTQRWEALLQAVDGLVQAFAAEKTLPTAPTA